jgi:hypothetical protein
VICGRLLLAEGSQCGGPHVPVPLGFAAAGRSDRSVETPQKTGTVVLTVGGGHAR